MDVIPHECSRPGSLEMIRQDLRREVTIIRWPWNAGTVPQNPGSAGERGVVCGSGCDGSVDVAEASRCTEDFPLFKAGMLDWFLTPIRTPLPVESVMDPAMDAAEPFGRRTR